MTTKYNSDFYATQRVALHVMKAEVNWLERRQPWDVYLHMYFQQPDAWVNVDRLRLLRNELNKYLCRIRAQSSRIDPNPLLAYSRNAQRKAILPTSDGMHIVYETALSLLQESVAFCNDTMTPYSQVVRKSEGYVDFTYHCLLRYKGLAYFLNEGLLAGKPAGHYQDLFAAESNVHGIGCINPNDTGIRVLYYDGWHGALLLTLALEYAIKDFNLPATRNNITKFIKICTRYGSK